MSTTEQTTTSAAIDGNTLVMRRFCVSLVYQKVKPGGVLDMALRSAVVEAVSQEEALGLMIMRMTEFENWQLNLKCVVSLENGA